MKPPAGTGRNFKLRRGSDAQRQLLQMNLRGFPKRRGNLLLIPKIVRSRWRICPAVTFVHFRGSSQMLLRSFAQRLRFIEKNNRPQRALRSEERRVGKECR